MIQNKVPSGRWIYLLHVPNDTGGKFRSTETVVKYIKSGGVGANRYWRKWVIDRALDFCFLGYVENEIKEEFFRLYDKYESRGFFLERKFDRKELFTQFFREASRGNSLALGRRSVYSELKSSVNWFYWYKRKPPVFKNENTLSRLVYKVPVSELRERFIFKGVENHHRGGICVTPWIVPYRYLVPELKQLVPKEETKDWDRIENEWDFRLNSDFGGVVQQLEMMAEEVYRLGKPQYLAIEAARAEARAEAAKKVEKNPAADAF